MKQQTLTNYEATVTKHRQFLAKFGAFPDKTRKGVWAQLLRLPLNHQHFGQLTKPYPLLPQHTTDKRVAFTVAAIGRLYPDLKVEWLPGLIHPFVVLFREDAIAGFEIALTFLLNWLRPLFKDYPNSSKAVMNFFSRQLPDLERRVNSLDYPLSAVIQPLLLVVLTDILNKEQTLKVFDFLVSRPFSPELFLCVTAAIAGSIEPQLCKIGTIQEIACALRREKTLDIAYILDTAGLMAKREAEQLAQIYRESVFPLSKGRYPVATFIPNDPLPTSDKLKANQEQTMQRLEGKFTHLESLINDRLKEGTITNMADIDKRYQDVEGQMRQYVGQLKQQHTKKMVALREMEERFKDKVEGQERARQHQYELELEAIERRGRVEREVQLMREEAESIREAERAMMLRLEQVAREKKEQLVRQNEVLRAQQRVYI